MKQRLCLRQAAAAATVLLFFCGFLSGCGSAQTSQQDNFQVVCTIFPEYDWTRQIVGDTAGVSVSLLVKNGTDLHSYQPSVKDIARIAEADLFCYVGGASDDWVTDVLETAGNEQVPIVSMLTAADAAEEILVPGMQEEAHHHQHEHHHEEEEEEEAELDEHVWLSLRRAQLCCQAICDALCEMDESHAAQYQANCAAYLAQLQAMDEAYTERLAQEKARDIIVVADRFPFRYLAEDYGLTYAAAFPGCSAETEASFETIVYLAQQVEQHQLPCVLVTESSDGSLARTVLESASSQGEILILQDMQSVTEKQIDDGMTYLSQMEQNLQTLLQAVS